MNNPKLDLNYVFVYGSLKQGFHNHHHLEKSLFLGNAQVKGELLDIRPRGDFPALLGKKNDASKPTWVQGEVYIVDNDTLAQLDILEGEGQLYDRKPTIAQMDVLEGEGHEWERRLAVWAYFWGSKQSQNFPIIESGYWGWVKTAKVKA